MNEAYFIYYPATGRIVPGEASSEIRDQGSEGEVRTSPVRPQGWRKRYRRAKIAEGLLYAAVVLGWALIMACAFVGWLTEDVVLAADKPELVETYLREGMRAASSEFRVQSSETMRSACGGITSSVAAATASPQGEARDGDTPHPSADDTFPQGKAGMTCLGNYYVTGYDVCVSCCGKTDGITASGAEATVGRTCAANGLPFGSRLYIVGLGERVVEDRGGMQGKHIDVLCEDHPACYAVTGYYTVYLIEEASAP